MLEFIDTYMTVNKIKEHYFKVKRNERLQLTFQSDQEQRYWEGLLHQIPVDEDFWVAIKEKRPIRTLAQNNYYWLYMDGISKETGYTPEEMHEYCKSKFLDLHTLVVREQMILVAPSTTDLTIKEFMEYIKKIEIETGVPAPDTRLCGLYEHIYKAGMLDYGNGKEITN